MYVLYYGIAFVLLVIQGSNSYISHLRCFIAFINRIEKISGRSRSPKCQERGIKRSRF